MVVNDKRALAHIEKVTNIRPIPNADRIEQVSVLGWNLVTKKGEFADGDLCVYIEIDSRVPSDMECFKFLEDRNYKVKTIKLRKVISQGLALPISILPEGNYGIGQDVTDILKITKIQEDYDPAPISLEMKLKAHHKKLTQNRIFKKLMKYGWFRKFAFSVLIPKKKKNGWPSWVKKTDEERCLVGDTKIDTDLGLIRISDIVNKNIKCSVKSYNENTDKIEYKPIVDTQKIKKNNEILYKIGYINKGCTNRLNHVVCTSDHKFYNGKSYVRADELNIGDSIYTNEYVYDKNIYKYIYGMILGDACVRFENRKTKSGKYQDSFRICFCHGEKQLEYIKFKKNIFGSENHRLIEGKSGYSENKIYSFATDIDYGIVEDLNRMGCIQNRKFIITKEFCDNLTPESLAIWYMDDGSISHKSDSCSPSIRIATNSFSENEVKLLVDCLNNKFGIDCNIRKSKKYFDIYITVMGTKKFLDLITKFIHPSMRYKTLEEFEDIEFAIKNTQFFKSDKLIKREVLSVEKISSNAKYVYDITVDENHNFFANNILTNNCQNMPWILENKSKFIATEKLDGTSSTYTLVKKPFGKYDFIVCSRNVVQDTPSKKCFYDDNVYWEMAKKYSIESVLRYLIEDNDWITLQGETIGESIQKNKYNITGRDFYAFNLITSGAGRIDSVTARDTLKEYGIKFVPILSEEYILPDTVDELMSQVKGESKLYPTLREGIVFRNYEQGISFKCVSNDFLIKWGL